ncbi:MAG: YkgJ family cysteine cluster protein [Methanomicrobiales archaeon]|nr:YkgJ family cysteine cluster protein [Methanomicrobiales archaeon]
MAGGKHEAREDVARDLLERGFSCTRCGACCEGSGDAAPVVLLSPGEIREIMSATGRIWDEVAEPYNEFIPTREGGRFTLAWCLRRQSDRCIFYQGGCTIYPVRPWICRTYPFVLEDGTLQTSTCPGVGLSLTSTKAAEIAVDLFARALSESCEEVGVRRVLSVAKLGPGLCAVIDSEGVKVLDG